MKIVKMIFMAVAQVSFVSADILFMRSVFCKFHPLIAYWVFHLPIHYLNSLLLFKLYRSRASSAGVETYRWDGRGLPVFILHLKALVQISTGFCMLFLIGVFKEPLSDGISDGLDVYLLGSIALLVVYATIVSSYLPNFNLGVSLTASLTGLYMSMLYNICGISFEVKGVALMVLLALLVIKIYVEFAIECRNRHGLGLHPPSTQT